MQPKNHEMSQKIFLDRPNNFSKIILKALGDSRAWFPPEGSSLLLRNCVA